MAADEGGWVAPKPVSTPPAPGYPEISDPEHPLYEQAQEGWPDFEPHEAMREAARDSVATRVNSNSHPAFSSSYIVNDQAERERQQKDEALTPAKPRR